MRKLFLALIISTLTLLLIACGTEEPTSETASSQQGTQNSSIETESSDVSVESSAEESSVFIEESSVEESSVVPEESSIDEPSQNSDYWTYNENQIIRVINDRIYILYDNGKYAMVDENYKYVVKFRFSNIYEMGNTIVALSSNPTNTYYAVWDKQLNVILPYNIYSYVYCFGDFVVSKTDGDYEIRHIDKKEIVYTAENFKEFNGDNILIVENDISYLIGIDNNGEIVKLKFDPEIDTNKYIEENEKSIRKALGKFFAYAAEPNEETLKEILTERLYSLNERVKKSTNDYTSNEYFDVYSIQPNEKNPYAATIDPETFYLQYHFIDPIKDTAYVYFKYKIIGDLPDNYWDDFHAHMIKTENGEFLIDSMRGLY